MLCQIRNGRAVLGGKEIFTNLEMDIHGTEKIALVGPNGAGKTTLLRLLAGEYEWEPDDRHPEGGMRTSRRITVGMLSQTPLAEASITVEEHLLREYFSSRGLEWEIPALYERERYAFENAFDRFFTGFGFRAEDKKRYLGEFSGGQLTKIAMIRLLLMEPDLLLLDEPTNHLDVESVEWLEEYLHSYPKACVVVSHDRYFLDETADVVYELYRGRLTRYAGNYSEYRRQRQKKAESDLRRYREQEEEVQRLEALIEKFKNKPRKAAFARSRKKILERMERMDRPEPWELSGHFPELQPMHPGSKWVWEGEGAVIGYEKPLRTITFRLRRGQKLGIIGPNGSGKSTFMKTVAGRLPVLKGKINAGLGIEMAYYDQQTAAIESDLQVLDYFREKYPVMTQKEVRQLLGGYGFSGRDVMTRVSELSGGEKTRLTLAVLLTQQPNFLILDEPTNHLDISGMECLEQVLKAYRGTVLIVSHDRYFLKKTVESLLVFEGEEVLYYPFGYDHYRRKRVQSVGSEMAALRTAEEQALIESLKAVPRAEHHRLREIGSEEGYQDWHFRLAREELDAAWMQLDELIKSIWTEEYWMKEGEKERIDHKLMEYNNRLTQICLGWYDVWLDAQMDETAEE